VIPAGVARPMRRRIRIPRKARPNPNKLGGKQKTRFSKGNGFFLERFVEAYRRTRLTVPCHGMAGDPGGGPSGLKVESPGNPVDVQRFPREIQAGDFPAFHGFHIHLLQRNPSAGHKLLLVHAFADDLEFLLMEFPEEKIFFFPRKFGPALVRGDAGESAQLLP